MRFDGLLFDLYDTLLPWHDGSDAAVFRALAGAFHESGLAADGLAERARRVRREMAGERDAGDMREITVAEFVERLCDGAAPDGLADRAAAAMRAASSERSRAPEGLTDLLARLARRYPIGIVSNFGVEEVVETVLEREGIAPHVVHVEVSVVNGFRKPHPDLFEAARNGIGTAMERTLMVGDNVWADVVGGHRAGLLTALTHEHRQGPTSDPRAPGIAPDRILKSLDELLD